jgi:hypothetical protein
MMTGFERYTKKTRRAMFLEEMEQVVPLAKKANKIVRFFRQLALLPVCAEELPSYR